MSRGEMSISSKVKKEGQRFNGRDAQSPHYYGSHWDIEENQLRNQVGRSPREKFNVEFEYDLDTSSGSSMVFNHPHHQQLPPQTITQKNQVRYYHTEQPHYQKHNNMHAPNHGGNRTPDRDRMPGTLFYDEKDGSEIWVDQRAKPPASVYSHYSGKSRAPSEMSSVKTKKSTNAGVVVETMSAPNPCCPNTKGVCCLLVLVNLGLILITIGFSIVLQLFEPEFVWFFGIAFLIVGFIALIASLVFCLHLCRESQARGDPRAPGEMYWTHHWQKRIALPGMNREVEKDDVSTVYSARNEPDDKYYTREDRRDMTPIHTYRHQ